MCQHCDLNRLSPSAFDSFFDRALAEGTQTLVCRRCGTVFSTDLLLLHSGTAAVPDLSAHSSGGLK